LICLVLVDFSFLFLLSTMYYSKLYMDNINAFNIDWSVLIKNGIFRPLVHTCHLLVENLFNLFTHGHQFFIYIYIYIYIYERKDSTIKRLV
jgi:hypothetical protein